MRQVTIALVGVHSPNYYAAEHHIYEKSLADLSALCKVLGCRLVDAGLIQTAAEAIQVRERLAAENPDCLLIQNSGFSMGDVALELGACPVPLCVWAVPEPMRGCDIQLHSLVSQNLFISIFRRLPDFAGCFVDWVYGSAQDAVFVAKFTTLVGALKAQCALRQTRVGCIGGVAPSFYNLEPDVGAARHRFGVETVTLPFADVVRAAEALPNEEIAATQRTLQYGAAMDAAVRPEHLRQAAKGYAALRKLCEKHNLSALAVACWPDFQQHFGIVPCVALSALQDQLGIPTACEGDFWGALSMVMLAHMSGKTAMLADLTDLSIADEAALLWHCGAGSVLYADAPRLINHPMITRRQGPEAAMGVAYDFAMRSMPLTIARLTNQGQSVLGVEGEVLEHAPQGYVGTRGWVGALRLEGQPLRAMDLLETLFSEGVEHHLALTQGHVTAQIKLFARLTGTAYITAHQA